MSGGGGGGGVAQASLGCLSKLDLRRGVQLSSGWIVGKCKVGFWLFWARGWSGLSV